MADLRELMREAVNKRLEWTTTLQGHVIADAILAALDTAGLVVVPREATEVMAKAGKKAFMPPTTFQKYMTTMEEAWEAMIAASPFSKKEVG